MILGLITKTTYNYLFLFLKFELNQKPWLRMITILNTKIIQQIAKIINREFTLAQGHTSTICPNNIRVEQKFCFFQHFRKLHHIDI